MGKTCRREISLPDRGIGRNSSKSGPPAEIGRYHMYASGHGNNIRSGKFHKNALKTVGGVAETRTSVDKMAKTDKAP